jgi:hypothetical protein
MRGAGARTQTQVGLGSARKFSSGPAQQVSQNVPVVLRAFANIFDDEDKLPRASRYAPYRRLPKRRVQRRQQQRARRDSVASITSTASASSALLGELGHYFPFVVDSSAAEAEAELALPLRPETLVTPGVRTTLALPLSPSLAALLEPASVPYADAEAGAAALSRITHGMVPLHAAYAAAGARIVPLISRLELLGVLHAHAYPRATAHVSLDSRGEPDVLRIVFAGRSAADVRALVGDLESGVISQARELVEIDEDEALARWREPVLANPVFEPVLTASPAPISIPPSPSLVMASVDSLDLVMPTLDLSVAPTVVPSSYDLAFDVAFEEDSYWPPSASMAVSSSASTVSSPSSSGHSTPRSSGSWASDSTTPMSLTPPSPSSVLSSISSLSSLSALDAAWIAPPSEADADLDAWSDVASDRASASAQFEADAVEVHVSWVDGSLSLTQAW